MSAPEVRIDQLTGLRTVLAPGRAERPDAFTEALIPQSADDGECPFCEGREDRTPPEVEAMRPGGGEPNSPGWTTRVVPNLYPVLSDSDETEGPRGVDSGLTSPADPLRASSRVAEPDLFAASPAAGAHEVIVNTPRHVASLVELDEDSFAAAIDAWRERIRAHAGDAAYSHLIVNEGPAAGASLEHTHAQLYALDFVPTVVARERERFTAYHERTAGAHLLEDVAAEEVRRAERLVAIDDEALLVAPWASRSPFELRVIPRRPAPCFEDEGAAGTGMIHTALGALARLFGSAPQLNLWVRTAPRDVEEFHWHVDILPRLTVRAGFEMGTGIEVNVYPPERAAEDLRRVLA
ncbi:MAG: galactose-1-phosphate uridylyltransferase [Solirubrobacterales bacterium]